MGTYFQKTLIPTPNIDYKEIWKNAPEDLSDTLPRYKSYPIDHKEIWNTEISKQLISAGLAPSSARVFRWAPNLDSGWHIDGSPNRVTQFAINWIMHGSGVIQWNSKLDLSNTPKVSTAKGWTPSNKFHTYEEQIDGHGCIVNTAVPHRVVNNSNEHRITVSVVFEKNSEITYNDAVIILSNIGFIE
jgi:hypothetical protein